MPLGLRLPPLFARSKTTSSLTTSDPESLASTAATSSITNASVTKLKKQRASSLHSRRGRSKLSPERAQSVPSDDKRKSSVTPPSTALQSSFGVDSSLLGSVGEEKEELDGTFSQHIAITPSQLRPELVLHEATPPPIDTATRPPNIVSRSPLALNAPLLTHRPQSADGLSIADSVARQSSSASPKHVSRRPSLVDSANAIVQPKPRMVRKIWVKRPNASATLVQVREDDLVDDVREMILRKYANSLGRTFDAPDMTLRIVARNELGPSARSERTLGPEEEICHTLEMAYPGGQTVEEALVIDVPTRRTPKPSPRAYQQHYYGMEDHRPAESDKDYFPPMSAVMQPVLPGTSLATISNHHHPSISGHDHQRSMAVLTTGQLPPLPSPGSTRTTRRRPNFARQHTSSPTIVQHNQVTGMPMTSIPANMIPHRASNRPRVDSSASETHHPANGIPPAPAMPTPPAPEAPPTARGQGSSPPTPSTVATGLTAARGSRPRKARKPTPTKTLGKPRQERRGSHEAAAQIVMPQMSNMLEGIVPPINVLIVEDNSINLKLLEKWMKRLRVRWDSAVNGKIAVDKWRTGGYHLILMDIQMPVMNGIEATKEIRRLEKVNGIGVFSSSTPSSPEETRARQKEYMDGMDTDSEAVDTDATETAVKRDSEADKLTITDSIFKSPIIIVALTASALQSDRHAALAAGCNDFLTKPVNLEWLERKVKEWGCMQALIDFDGWKRWRDINEKEEAGKTEEQKQKEMEKEDKQQQKMAKFALLQETQAKKRREEEEKKRAAARAAAANEENGINGDGLTNGH